ncbi:MAG: YraN family protein [Pirellulales bacterium]|nr:YraN family protein [Pirellulales bacterium]
MGLLAVLRRWFDCLAPSKSLGLRGEKAAARHLARLGYRIVGRRVQLPSGELDLVALDGQTIVFVEVKTRESDLHGHASDAVTPAKQRRLTRLAVTFLKRHRLHDHPARFDVVAVTWPPGGKPRIEHYKNAFEAVGRGEFYS